MPLTTIPAVDQNICSGWTEQDINLYNKLDFYLAKLQAEKRKTWAIWSKLVGKIPWTPNMGATMRGVRKEPSPHLRQFAFPRTLDEVPVKDVVQVRELKAETQVRRHRFESPIMNYLPSFRDFLTDHVDAHGKDIEEKKIRFEDIFLRGEIWWNSPHVWLPDCATGELKVAPMERGNSAGTASSSKNTAWLQGQLPLIGNPGNLSLNTLNVAVTTMEVDLRVPPFKGSSTPTGDSQPPGDMYCLVCSSEAWNQFIYDPWLLANKNCDLNVITQGFRGNLFGRISAKLEDLPMRIAADGTFPQPETLEVAEEAYNFGESVLEDDYKDAPYEVAFLLGAEGYKALEVGPPPKIFASKGMPEGFGKMFWNGEIMVTKNLIIPCVDDEENTTYEANNYGEYLKFISQITLGIIGQQKRNVMPIIFKRRRGAAAS